MRAGVDRCEEKESAFRVTQLLVIPFKLAAVPLSSFSTSAAA
jgi:hypothetical protein